VPFEGAGVTRQGVFKVLKPGIEERRNGTRLAQPRRLAIGPAMRELKIPQPVS
jgi:hypothetical protein